MGFEPLLNCYRFWVLLCRIIDIVTEEKGKCEVNTIAGILYKTFFLRINNKIYSNLFLKRWFSWQVTLGLRRIKRFVHNMTFFYRFSMETFRVLDNLLCIQEEMVINLERETIRRKPRRQKLFALCWQRPNWSCKHFFKHVASLEWTFVCVKKEFDIGERESEKLINLLLQG